MTLNSLFNKRTAFLYHIFLNPTLFALLKHIIISLIVIIIISNYLLYRYQLNKWHKNAYQTSIQIDEYLIKTFKQTEQFMVYIGKRIARGNYTDPTFILDSFKNTPSIEEYGINNNTFSWTFLDWVDSNNFLTVNQKIGILTHPYDMSHRSHIVKCREAPSQLYFSEPDIGQASGFFIIPAGVGIFHDNNFIGILQVGFHINELHKELMNILIEGIEFVITDDKREVIFSSHRKDQYTPQKSYFEISLSNNNQEAFDKPLKFNKISFYSKRNSFPPYTIFTGFNDTLFYQQFIFSALKITSLWCIIGLICFVLVYSASQKTIYITRMSEKARKNFIYKINRRLIDRDIDNTIAFKIYDKLIKCFDEVILTDNKIKKNDFLLAIQRAILNFKNFPVNKLEISPVDINSVIERALILKSKDVLEKNILIKTRLSPNLPFIYADQLCMEQIIVGFLSLAIEYGPPGGKVEIYTSLKEIRRDKELLIIIEDTGFGITQEDINRITSIFKEYTNDYTSLSLEELLYLVKINNGECVIDNRLNQGTIVTLRFILNLPTQVTIDRSKDSAQKNNVLLFPFKKL